MDGLKAGLNAAAALAVSVFLGLPAALQALLIAQALDVASGLLAAGARKDLDSRIGALGIRKKGAAWIVVGLVALVASAFLEGASLKLPGGADVGPTEAVAWFYVANEALSVLENAAQTGLPVPKLLRDRLAQVRDQA